MYKIYYSRAAIRALKKMPKLQLEKVISKIDKLAEDPYGPIDVKALKGRDANRLRVGGWRIIYQIKDTKLEILVIKIALRSKVYKL